MLTMSVDYSLMEKEELIKLLNRLDRRAKYGLHFEPQSEDFLDKLRQHTPLLRKNSDKCINGNGPVHIFIEGENYHALQVLNHTHKQRIDLIYIDPPYNTGNKDFVYNDSFVDDKDSFRHSKWLSFMSRRLKLAKELLKNDGAIVISIDDNEFAQLKLLCDNVFGEDNFVECIPWRKKGPKGKQPTTMMVNCHEYLMVYKKSDAFSFRGTPRDIADYPNDDNDGYGPYANNNQNLKSTTKSPDKAVTITEPGTGRTFTDTWSYGIEQLEKFIQDGKIIWPKKDDGQPRIRDYLWGKERQFIALSSEWISERESIPKGWPNVEQNTKMVKSMLPEVDFPHPKPIKLIEYLISTTCGEDAIILDFFAGSGTTGHAVMNLNAADGGTRRCILCTNNENGIAERITYPRLVAAINGWKQGKNSVPGTNASLAYFQLRYLENKTTADETYLNLQKKFGGITMLKHHCFEVIHAQKVSEWIDFVIFGGAESTGPVYSVLIFNVYSIPEAVAWFEREGILENVHFSVFSYGTFAYEDDFPETELAYTVSPYPEQYLVSLEATKKIGG
jgi:adenine-specific DNA-methyltransferase